MEATRRLIGIALLCASSAGCSFRVVPGSGMDAEVVPDAMACVDLTKSCVTSTVLRDCQTVGQLPVDTTCGWGCLDAAQPAHCGKLQPGGGAMAEADLVQGQGLMDIATTAGGVINTDDGSITNVRVAGPNIVSGIEFEVRNIPMQINGVTRKVGVFRVKSLALVGNWTVTGANALAIASLGDVVIQGELDLRGDCVAGNAGPGGTPGKADDADKPGGGNGGAASGNDSSGGGGGGYGADGGSGGRINGAGTGGTPGTAWGDEMISALVGGGGGGGGGGTNDGIGGGGGGAIQIAANGKVSIRIAGATSGINAGGCGGKGGADAGGGGGAGGAILVEAPIVELDGTGTYLVVNGGGGGGGGNTSAAGNGGNGGWGSTAAAAGLKGGGPDGSGGTGGAAGSLIGQNGQDSGSTGGNDSGGGGGGGVGRIRVLTRLPDGVKLTTGSVVSPTFDETMSTATKGTATIK